MNPNAMTSSSDTREQLSAMMDGELDRDTVRFLLRRCEGERALVDCWQRWHVAGELLRGQAAVPVRIDLVRSVSLALAQEHGPAQSTSGFRRNALRWGGGFAVAASVALAALIVVQPTAEPAPATLAADAPDPGLAPAAISAVASASVAASRLREQDLRPPYRLDAQTVSDEGWQGPLRFDPRIERYL